jgi:heat shock protein HtpX
VKYNQFGDAKVQTDSGLVSRMYFTMFMLGILYAIFAIVLWGLSFPIVFIGLIIGAFFLFHYFSSGRMALWSSGAKLVTAEQEPELQRSIKRLVDRAGMPMPKVAVIQSQVPNAFATGRNPANSLVAVTAGIHERLSERELDAVLAHELGHVRNRDMQVLAIGNVLVTLTRFLMTMFFWSMLFGGMGGRGRDNNGSTMLLVYLVTIVVYFVGQLLVVALNRYREFGAGHSGAEISGDPGALASTLEKISGQMARIPDQDLRKLQTASAFLFIPVALRLRGGASLFSIHPPVGERIRRLKELELRMSFGMR